MLTIKNMGYNSTHRNGIDVDRPDGSQHYLLLLVKSPAYFEFTKEQLMASCNSLNKHTPGLKEEHFPIDNNTKKAGLFRQYVNKPAFILYTRGTAQRYYYDDIYINDWIVFDGPEAEEFLDSLNIPLNTLTVLSNHTDISSLIRELKIESLQTGSHHNEIMDARLKTIFYKYSDIYHLEIRLSDKLKQHRKNFSEIRNNIYNNNLPKPTVNELAAELNMSVSYFQHIYKELFGVSVIQDIIKSRIEKACYLLLITQDPISKIAENCGYENIEHFNRQFKSITGFTPSQYKAK